MIRKIVLPVIAATAFLAYGCAEPPTKEIELAKTSIDSVVAEGGEVYAPKETRDLNDSFGKAMEEVQSQEKVLFKKYDKAKELLAVTTNEAKELDKIVITRKAAAKENAENAIRNIESKINEIVTLLNSDEAKKGKGEALDVAIMLQDMNGYSESVNDTKKLIDSGDYLQVPEKVELIQSKIGIIENEVKAVIEKRKQAAEKKVLLAKKKDTKKPKKK